MAFLGYPRGHRVNTETWCPKARAYRRLGCSPSNPNVSRTDWPPPEQDRRRWTDYSARRSSGLRFQFFCVEVFSFFPKCQRNGCDLAGQRKACHGWLDALGDRGLIKLLEWSGPDTRSGGYTFEQTFQIMVVIFIEAANGKHFLGAPQLALHIAPFCTDARLQSQSAIPPQLTLGAKTGGSLNDRHQESGADRSHIGNLP